MRRRHKWGPRLPLGRGVEGDAHVFVLEFLALACSHLHLFIFVSPPSRILRFIVYECVSCLSLLSQAKEIKNRDE